MGGSDLVVPEAEDSDRAVLDVDARVDLVAEAAAKVREAGRAWAAAGVEALTGWVTGWVAETEGASSSCARSKCRSSAFSRAWRASHVQDYSSPPE